MSSWRALLSVSSIRWLSSLRQPFSTICAFRNSCAVTMDCVRGASQEAVHCTGTRAEPSTGPQNLCPRTFIVRPGQRLMPSNRSFRLN